jgi:predicted RND superfamily exporter protein
MEQILSKAAEVYGEDVFVTGTAMSTYDIANAFQGDLLKVNLITLLAILLIVTVSFRSFRLPLLMVFVIEGAIWITMGISFLIGEPIFFISYLICLSIQMGATIDYGILLCDQYRLLRRQGIPAREALCGAMRKALPTILTSGLILTVAGFIIGKRCSIYYISSIGLLVSRGALVSSVLVLTLLPALLLLCDRRIIRKTKTN